MPSPGRSSVCKRSSESGSPKCMNRPPLQVPIAVVVGSIAHHFTRARRFAPDVFSGGEARRRARSQRRLQALQRMREDLLVGLCRDALRGAVGVGANCCLRLLLHPGVQLLELRYANREILAALVV